MKLVKDWKQSWRWISQRCMAIAITIQTIWVTLPEDMKASIPPAWVASASIIVLILGMVGRVIDQQLNTGDGDVGTDSE